MIDAETSRCDHNMHDASSNHLMKYEISYVKTVADLSFNER